MRYQPQGRIQFDRSLPKRPCAGFVGTAGGLRILGDGKHDLVGRSTGPSIVSAGGASGWAAKTLNSSTDSVRLNALANQTDTIWEKPRTQITVMLVFRRFGNPAGVSPLFGNQCPNDQPFTAWCLEDQASGYARLEIAFASAGNPSGITSSVLIPNNQQVVLIGRYDGAKMDLWQNGVQVGSVAATGTIYYPNVGDRGPSVSGYYNYTGSNRSAQIEAYAGALWDAAISDAEIAQYSANPWMLWDAGSISVYQSAITSLKSFAYSALGGAVFGGSAARTRSISRVPVGSLTMGGSGQAVRGAARTAQGGLTLAGAGSIVRCVARAAAGGLKFAGAAAMSATAQVQARVITPVGGLLLAGAAAVSRATSRAVSGGITFSGHALKTAGAAGALLASLLPIFARRRRR